MDFGPVVFMPARRYDESVFKSFVYARIYQQMGVEIKADVSPLELKYCLL